MDISEVKQRFLNASETGREVLILKADEQCNCFNPLILSESEPDPTCKKCLGTGKTRISIKTGKIRSQFMNDASISQLEKTLYQKYTKETLIFFFPSEYKYLNNSDLICIFTDETCTEIDKIFEVKNKVSFIYEQFLFYEVYATKISHSVKWSVDDG